MWKNRIVYFFTLIAAFIFYICYPRWASWYVLLLVIILPVFSGVLGAFSLLSLRLAAQGGGDCPRGEQSTAAFGMSCRFAPPGGCRLWVEIEDLISGEITRQKLFLDPAVPAYIDVPTGHCGEFRVTPRKARAYDMLGLIAFPVSLPCPCVVTVLPGSIQPEKAPDFTLFRTKAYRPKPGGGFSEIHEMREYRPGDPLRSVHWKLSAKSGELIVRQAQEPLRRSVLISFDLTRRRDELDSVLDQVRWTSSRLIELQVEHSIGFIASAPTRFETAVIKSAEDLEAFLRELIRRPLAKFDPVPGRFPQADWHYHVRPAGTREVAE